MLQTSFSRLLKRCHFHNTRFAPDSEGSFTFDIQTGINTHSLPGFDCIHQPESVSPTSCSQLLPLQPESRLMLLPYQRWRCLQLRGKTKERPGERGWEGWTFPLTGWQPTGHRGYLSLAAGLSAGPVNLPDRSLQVPLIPLIQFISLTARMQPLSAGKIKPSLHSYGVGLCCPRDGKPNPLSLTRR